MMETGEDRLIAQMAIKKFQKESEKAKKPPKEKPETPPKEPKKKQNRSPITNPNLQYTFKDEDERKAAFGNALRQVMTVQKAPKVRDDEEARDRIEAYMQSCMANGVRPIYEEMALVLGTTKSSLWDWENGRYKGPISAGTIRWMKELLAAFDARMAIDNYMNPVLYFFRAKNFYGMKDQTEYVVTPNVEQPDRKKLIEDAEILPDD